MATPEERDAEQRRRSEHLIDLYTRLNQEQVHPEVQHPVPSHGERALPQSHDDGHLRDPEVAHPDRSDSDDPFREQFHENLVIPYVERRIAQGPGYRADDHDRDFQVFANDHEPSVHPSEGSSGPSPPPVPPAGDYYFGPQYPLLTEWDWNPSWTVNAAELPLERPPDALFEHRPVHRRTTPEAEPTMGNQRHDEWYQSLTSVPLESLRDSRGGIHSPPSPPPPPMPEVVSQPCARLQPPRRCELTCHEEGVALLIKYDRRWLHPPAVVCQRCLSEIEIGEATVIIRIIPLLLPPDPDDHMWSSVVLRDPHE